VAASQTAKAVAVLGGSAGIEYLALKGFPVASAMFSMANQTGSNVEGFGSLGLFFVAGLGAAGSAGGALRSLSRLVTTPRDASRARRARALMEQLAARPDATREIVGALILGRASREIDATVRSLERNRPASRDIAAAVRSLLRHRPAEKTASVAGLSVLSRAFRDARGEVEQARVFRRLCSYPGLEESERAALEGTWAQANRCLADTVVALESVDRAARTRALGRLEASLRPHDPWLFKELLALHLRRCEAQVARQVEEASSEDAFVIDEEP
jgi:hypothetical protein